MSHNNNRKLLYSQNALVLMDLNNSSFIDSCNINKYSTKSNNYYDNSQRYSCNNNSDSHKYYYNQEKNRYQNNKYQNNKYQTNKYQNNKYQNNKYQDNKYQINNRYQNNNQYSDRSECKYSSSQRKDMNISDIKYNKKYSNYKNDNEQRKIIANPYALFTYVNTKNNSSNETIDSHLMKQTWDNYSHEQKNIYYKLYNIVKENDHLTSKELMEKYL